MAKLVLHIGAHKTGTSYLQSLFHHNRTLLRADGIHYPDIGPNITHHALTAAWMELTDIPSGALGPEGAEGLWRKLLSDYVHRKGTVFLSAENFSRAQPKAVDMANLAQRLSGFESVHLIYTARRQVELLQSIWMQVAKNRKVLNLRSFVETALETFFAGGLELDHGAVYARLLKGFAPGQITVLNYAHFSQHPGGMLQIFLDLLGSRLRPEDFKPAAAHHANISPDPLAMYAASQITQGSIPPAELVEKIGPLIHPETGVPTTLLTRSEYIRINRAFARRNAIFANKIKLQQPEFSFDPAPAPANMFYRDDLTVQHWAAIAAFLYQDGKNTAPDRRSQTLWNRILNKSPF